MPESDLALLPPDLASRSRSAHDILLEGEDVERAITHLAAQGRRLETWEGWVWFPDGGRTRSLVYAGPFALPLDVERAAAAAREGIARAMAAWQRAPEYPGAMLTFCLVVAPT